jgi:hypothetical protein
MYLEDYIKDYLPWQVDIVGHIVVQVWKRNPIFCTNWLTDYNLVDVIELIPVFIPVTKSSSQSFFIIEELIYSVTLSVLDPRKREYLEDYSLAFEHTYMTTIYEHFQHLPYYRNAAHEARYVVIYACSKSNEQSLRYSHLLGSSTEVIIMFLIQCLILTQDLSPW